MSPESFCLTFGVHFMPDIFMPGNRPSDRCFLDLPRSLESARYLSPDSSSSNVYGIKVLSILRIFSKDTNSSQYKANFFCFFSPYIPIFNVYHPLTHIYAQLSPARTFPLQSSSGLSAPSRKALPECFQVLVILANAKSAKRQ